MEFSDSGSSFLISTSVQSRLVELDDKIENTHRNIRDLESICLSLFLDPEVFIVENVNESSESNSGETKDKKETVKTGKNYVINQNVYLEKKSLVNSKISGLYSRKTNFSNTKYFVNEEFKENHKKNLNKFI